MEIRRFGPGHRRPDGPPGTRGVTGQTIHHDARGTIVELAFGMHALMAPHTNPNTSYFVIISGGGFVQVGGERARVSHGEAIVWPAGEPHGAYTEGSEMRAIVVEFAGDDDSWARSALSGLTGEPLLHGVAPIVEQVSGRGPDPGVPTEPGEPGEPGKRADVGSLAEPGPRVPEDRDESSGEPW